MLEAAVFPLPALQVLISFLSRQKFGARREMVWQEINKPWEEEDRVEGEYREGYIQIVKSFGLPYDEKKRIPSPELLARRMNGK